MKIRIKNKRKVGNIGAKRETDCRTPIIGPWTRIGRKCIAKKCSWVEKNSRKLSTPLRKLLGSSLENDRLLWVT